MCKLTLHQTLPKLSLARDNTMNAYQNDLGQPIGFPITNWEPRPRPSRVPINGRFCHLTPVDPVAYASDLFSAYRTDQTGARWTYLPYGPFDTFADFQTWLMATCLKEDPFFFTIIDNQTNKAVGLASYLRIAPQMGVIEVGHIHFAAAMQKTAVATEAMYLMMHYVFDELGYRRYEWKCDALNVPSRKAAQRLGFQFEGIFRQALMYKGRNRDTAWFSIIDSEWPKLKRAFEQWLKPENFDGNGRQRQSLAAFR